jgi:Flp pilus assembly protein TadG
LRARHGERGQTMVEFALVSSFLFTMIFGVIDFGEALYAYDQVTDAARVGARWAMVRGDSCQYANCQATSASVKSYLLTKFPSLSSANLTVVWQPFVALGCVDGAFDGPGCIERVTVSYRYDFIYRFATIPFTSSSQMTISQ